MVGDPVVFVKPCRFINALFCPEVEVECATVDESNDEAPGVPCVVIVTVATVSVDG